ncbi:MAG: ABC transporter substrate-binding protein [Thermus sp.]|uniref:TRAP transporter substrate-binding protein n=1 Tax=unclassified Thermus TaxID=2619321 RepID=UPI000238A219|nr:MULTISPECIES: ABC transporter substrate-binding protein [unclassified Thermus]AEV16239.1 Twin-arginine translocation pathway signal [Thermus sp. CCB_US3_UF1]MCS7218541.1 ABC transporter substrate-binding protein [Thermus sp.]MDW8357386.1 ABC transporter substrate-binding protein [Thermus sp.]
MKRRDFLKRAGVGLAASLAYTAYAQAQPQVRWRLVSSYPRSLDTLYGGAEDLARRVADLTEGRFQIRVYQAGEIVPGAQVLDAVQQGTVEAGHTYGPFYVGKNPALAFDGGVPFGLTYRQHNAWMLFGGGLELLRGVYADFGLLQFPGGNTGAQMGGWFRKEIQTVNDLRGLRMRIPGLGGVVMGRLGVVPQTLAAGDIYPALERGTIDATEFSGPYDDEKLGFYKVARYYYYPSFWEPSAQLSFLVSQREWQRLPKEFQEAFQVAAAEVNLTMMAKYDALNPPALQRLLRAGVRLRRWPAEIMRKALQEAQALYEEQAAKDATYRKVYAAYWAFRGEQYRWFSVAELAYETFAFPSA